ncbi:MAG: hypothetical protein GXX96_38910 [Planctomycetaceae bacterium]|nr:hypothetical protein [Planctomycetaceae bacterium]
MSKSDTACCNHCNKEVHYHYDPINHWWHLLLSICSLGLWLPIWACVTFGPSKICDECGNPIWSDQPVKAIKR